ncbi:MULTISPECIES: hypothetical protein [Streptomyces]|jgi:hypothetical protein|uniref:STAS domain-containing protein n=1 Tax=Streptomyces spinosisporus TaxID=2927582 RepID=A0ABS9XSF2_9ACTN|nr:MULTISPECIES: hypothetical protein [Streptomyces]MCI3244870.1 hypothetical protein [Streptomyces spinosisporus]WUB41276.1 hypothetical protein OHN38_42660 [Streptomyces sp. NBC_00588]
MFGIRAGDWAAVLVAGDVAYPASDRLRHELDAAMATGPRRIAVDFRGVNF